MKKFWQPHEIFSVLSILCPSFPVVSISSVQIPSLSNSFDTAVYTSRPPPPAVVDPLLEIPSIVSNCLLPTSPEKGCYNTPCDRWKINFLCLHCKISVNCFCNVGSKSCFFICFAFQNSYWVSIQELLPGLFSLVFPQLLLRV